jgi:hypothetical protein
VRVSVADVTRDLEQRGLLTREREDHSERIIEHVRSLLGRDLPHDLIAFYRERVATLGEFNAQTPEWNDRVGWRSPPTLVTALLRAAAAPVFDDGCGSLYGLDLTAGAEPPAVYFFDHEDGFETPSWAAGSSLARFMLLLANKDRAYAERWPAKWELTIDPDIERCSRAPAIWDAG